MPLLLRVYCNPKPFSIPTTLDASEFNGDGRRGLEKWQGEEFEKRFSGINEWTFRARRLQKDMHWNASRAVFMHAGWAALIISWPMFCKPGTLSSICNVRHYTINHGDGGRYRHDKTNCTIGFCFYKY
jgi:hypothetical protein